MELPAPTPPTPVATPSATDAPTSGPASATSSSGVASETFAPSATPPAPDGRRHTPTANKRPGDDRDGPPTPKRSKSQEAAAADDVADHPPAATLPSPPAAAAPPDKTVVVRYVPGGELSETRPKARRGQPEPPPARTAKCQCMAILLPAGKKWLQTPFVKGLSNRWLRRHPTEPIGALVSTGPALLAYPHCLDRKKFIAELSTMAQQNGVKFVDETAGNSPPAPVCDTHYVQCRRKVSMAASTRGRAFWRCTAPEAQDPCMFWEDGLDWQSYMMLDMDDYMPVLAVEFDEYGIEHTYLAGSVEVQPLCCELGLCKIADDTAPPAGSPVKSGGSPASSSPTGSPAKARQA